MERDLTVQQPQFGRSARLYGHKPRSSVGRRVRQGDGLSARWAPTNLGLHRNRAVPPDNGVGSWFRAARHVSRPFVDPVKTPDMAAKFWPRSRPNFLRPFLAARLRMVPPHVRSAPFHALFRETTANRRRRRPAQRKSRSRGRIGLNLVDRSILASPLEPSTDQDDMSAAR